jgi:hypothetical protein
MGAARCRSADFHYLEWAHHLRQRQPLGRRHQARGLPVAIRAVRDVCLGIVPGV